MPEWLIEEGLGEHRALLIDRGQIRGARVDWLEPVRPGLIADAKLQSKLAGRQRGLALLPDGTEVLVSKLVPAITEGMTIRIEVTRAPIAERGRTKRALAKLAAEGAAPRPGPTLAAQLGTGPFRVTRCRPADGAFNDLGWDELVEDALSGAVAFASGNLLLDPTPGMTVIDIDGHLPPTSLALAAVEAIADALARFDIAGNVAIDFPTIESRKDRQQIDAALAQALAGWHGERTAMNGFGLVQLVSRLERPSILQRYRAHPERLGVVTLARRAEGMAGAGPLLLCINPQLRPHIPANFESMLHKRTGRSLDWHLADTIALTSPYVQVSGS
ncbi:MAG: ribonuclease E/G [Novosphingobium sp.]